MSVQAISWVLDYSAARLGAKLVLISIANHAKADGTDAWPSISTLAREAGLSDRQVQRAIKELVEIGELSIVFNGGPKGTNLYSLPKMSPRHIVTTTPDKSGSEGVTNMTETMSEMSPEPSLTVLEPSNTHPEGAFDEFYESYPKHIGRKKAERVWNRMGQAERKLAFAGLEVWKASAGWKRERGRYVPYPSTFLSQGFYKESPRLEALSGDSFDERAKRAAKK